MSRASRKAAQVPGHRRQVAGFTQDISSNARAHRRHPLLRWLGIGSGGPPAEKVDDGMVRGGANSNGQATGMTLGSATHTIAVSALPRTDGPGSVPPRGAAVSDEPLVCCPNRNDASARFMALGAGC